MPSNNQRNNELEFTTTFETQHIKRRTEMKTVVVFGATGTIGQYVSTYLNDKGYSVIAVGRRSSDNGFFSDNGIDYHSLDICDSESFEVLPRKVDSVVHLAGALPSAMEGYHPEQYIQTIMLGTLNVLNYCIEANTDRIIFSHSRADTSHLMGTVKPIPSDAKRSFPQKGDHAVYAICKNAAVDLIEHYHYEYGIKRFVLRLPTIYCYGPKSHYVNGKKQAIAYWEIIQQAMAGDDVEIWGDPTRAKEIVYVKDLLQIIEKCILSDREGGLYNVGNGKPVTLEEQILGIIEVFSDPVNRSRVLYRPDKPDARQFCHDISKTVRELGYSPQFSYIEMLKDMKLEMQKDRFRTLWDNEDIH